jgi:hypothetical protein
MSLYAESRPNLFIVLAPCVLATIAVLTLPSIMGLLLVVPGVLGLCGLTGLLLAWLGLFSPGLIRKAAPLVVGLLVMGLGAAAWGMAAAPNALAGAAQHADMGWLGGIVAPSVSFAATDLFFLWAVLGSFERPAGNEDKPSFEIYAAALLTAVFTAVIPIAVLIGANGYTQSLREIQGAEAESFGSFAQKAVANYITRNNGAMPPNNSAAGLPGPHEMQGDFVSSVTVVNGMITVRYGNDPIATLYALPTAGAGIILAPPSAAVSGASGEWRCRRFDVATIGLEPIYTRLCR